MSSSPSRSKSADPYETSLFSVFREDSHLSLFRLDLRKTCSILLPKLLNQQTRNPFSVVSRHVSMNPGFSGILNLTCARLLYTTPVTPIHQIISFPPQPPGLLIETDHFS